MNKKIFCVMSFFYGMALYADVFPTTFDATASQAAIAKFQTKLTAFNPTNVTTALSTLKAKIDAANQSSYATNTNVSAAVSSAQALYTALNAKLTSLPTQQNLTDLNAAYTNYTQFVRAQAFVAEINAIKSVVDTTLTNLAAVADDASASLTAAKQYFAVKVPGSVVPSFMKSST